MKRENRNFSRQRVRLMKTYVIRCFILFAVLLSGCATYKTSTLQRSIWEDTSAILGNIHGQTQCLSLQQIQDVLISNSSKLITFRANVGITFTTPDTKGPIRCSGTMLYQSPKSVRVVASKFATTLFDMVSDGNKFWLYIPLENTVYTGTCSAFHKIEAEGIRIFPGDIASLFNYKEILEGKPTLEIWPAYWLIHVLEMEKKDVNLKGNLLLDRVNAEVFRCELFNTDDSVRLQAVFANYTTYNECRIPQRIDVRWPACNASMGIAFSNIAVNKTLDPKVFMFTIPKGAQAITLD